MSTTFYILSLGGVGMFVLIGGILLRLGIYRSPYAMKGNIAFAPSGIGHILIPGSFVLFLYAAIPLFPTIELRRSFVLYLLFPYQLIVIILGIWGPWWLQPKWLRWLEQKHGTILELLWEDVRQDRWGWERRVRTQEDLEAWVAEVRQKHNL